MKMFLLLRKRKTSGMKNILLTFSVLFSLLSSLSAQTFSGTGGAIQDNNQTNFTQTVSGLTSNLDTNNFGLETVCININHSYVEDLEIRLVSPSGQSVLLIASVGGNGNNFTNTCLNVDAGVAIADGTAPFTGTFRPSGQMGMLNNNQSGNGVWTLKIADLANGDFGNLVSWKLTFGNNPASYFSFSSSNLPIVVINTNGQEIADDPKIVADMGIISNANGLRNLITDPRNNYNGKIGIELRGSTSQTFPKKAFGLELWDVNNNSIDSSILGMPKESDWVLNVSYSDKSLLRNSFTYRAWEKMGYYSPRGQHVELILNGEYWGVYYLCEKIKRGGDRVDISKLKVTDIAGDDLTGGYILKIDKVTGSPSSNWQSAYAPANVSAGPRPRILIEYPKMADIVPQQLNYIKSYVDSFERALATVNFLDTVNGYRHFADEASFIDYLLISEMNKNIDGYRISTYFSKDKNSKGGKLKMGPVWDYDIAFGNANYCDGWKTTGWGFNFGIACGQDPAQVPFWWKRLMQDSLFTNHLRCRWENLKPVVFDTILINNWIDSVALRLEESQVRNYRTWPILGTYVWPNYYIGDTYKDEVDSLKWWIKERYEWLDANIPGSLVGCGFTGVDKLAESMSFQVYPNPFSDEIRVKFSENQNEPLEITLVNMLGQQIFRQEIQPANGSITLQVPAECKPGVYFLSISKAGGKPEVKKLIRQ